MYRIRILSDESFDHEPSDIYEFYRENCGVVILQFRVSGPPLSQVRNLVFRCLTYTF